MASERPSAGPFEGSGEEEPTARSANSLDWGDLAWADEIDDTDLDAVDQALAMEVDIPMEEALELERGEAPAPPNALLERTRRQPEHVEAPVPKAKASPHKANPNPLKASAEIPILALGPLPSLGGTGEQGEAASFVADPSLHARVPVAPDVVPTTPRAEHKGPSKIARKRREHINLSAKGEIILGIDLGTTTCCAAILESGRVHVLDSSWGAPTIPSVVSYVPDGTLYVGEPALDRAASHAKHTILGSKRLVGRAFHSPIVQMVRDHFAYDIVQGDRGEAAILIDKEVVSLEEVSAHLLEDLKKSAELQLGKEVNRAVITCPAFFNERQRESVRVAGELAGFHVERVLSEPTAAALHYGLGRTFETRRVLVYDLGGGTFDVSVLEVDGTVFEVLATGGDTFLGGVDFDAAVAEILVQQFAREHGLDPRADEAALATVFRQAERAKIALSERPSTIVHLKDLKIRHHPPKDLTVPLRRSDVDVRFEALLEHTFRIVQEVVARVGLTVEEVDDILLVGGQTRYPLVQTRVREFFGQDPKESVNPDEAVARGAAQFAAGMDSLDSVVLIDALPMSIGIGLPGGRFEKLIERDARLPAQTTYSIRTGRNNQEEITILIFQGEEEKVAHNEPLGMLVLSGLPRGPKGTVVVDLQLRVTEECILDLSATERRTGKRIDSQFATKDTPEALRQKLGLPPQPSPDELEARRAELERPKGVWRWLTGVLGRKADG